MPTNIKKLFDHKFINKDSINGYLTKYFYDASFGKLILLADYYPRLVQIDYNETTINNERYLILDKIINSANLKPIITHNGYLLNSNDFDFF